MVGTNAKRTPLPLHKIYAKIFPTILRLAVDVELVARQLFEPLTMQLIHWFTKNSSFENPETMVLLDAIVDAVGDPTNSSLRDFSAKALTEFLQWSIKHVSPKQQKKNPFNAKSLFKRLYSLAHHPNPYKRLGCALTIKKLYRVFREDSDLVDIFVLEILHTMLFSLRLAASDPPSVGTVVLGEQVCDALGRVILSHVEKLVRPNPNRRMHKDLGKFVNWLFEEVGRGEPPVRKTAFGLFMGSFFVLCSVLIF
jgi:DNA-dependent protein kinase catalytic subunit